MFKDSGRIREEKKNGAASGAADKLNGKNPVVDFQYRMFDPKMLDKYFSGRGGGKSLSLAGRGPFC